MGLLSCVCYVMSLTSCAGSGPHFPGYLWLDPQRRARTMEVSEVYRTDSVSDCRALISTEVPPSVPVYNDYGERAHGCLMVWNNCRSATK